MMRVNDRQKATVPIYDKQFVWTSNRICSRTSRYRSSIIHNTVFARRSEPPLFGLHGYSWEQTNHPTLACCVQDCSEKTTSRLETAIWTSRAFSKKTRRPNCHLLTLLLREPLRWWLSLWLPTSCHTNSENHRRRRIPCCPQRRDVEFLHGLKLLKWLQNPK